MVCVGRDNRIEPAAVETLKGVGRNSIANAANFCCQRICQPEERERGEDAHAIPYDYIDIERDERAAAEVLRLNRGMRSVPTIVFPDSSVLVEPSARDLSAKCLQEPEPSLGERLKSLYKCIVRKES